MKVIRIFIASSSELREDRDQFQMFIGRENDRLFTKDIHLKLVQWENFLDAISNTRLQDEYNLAIKNCDIVLCLFFTKVGKYTAEEFDTAYQHFKDTQKPKIWTYFKNAPLNTGSITEEINTLLQFKKKIRNLGHFYTEYTNIDNLINKFRDQLDKFLTQIEGEQYTEVHESVNEKARSQSVMTNRPVSTENISDHKIGSTGFQRKYLYAGISIVLISLSIMGIINFNSGKSGPMEVPEVEPAGSYINPGDKAGADNTAMGKEKEKNSTTSSNSTKDAPKTISNIPTTKINNPEADKDKNNITPVQNEVVKQVDYVNILLIVDSKFSNAEITVDGQQADIVDNGLTIKKIRVENNKRHTIVATENGKSCTITAFIEQNNQQVTCN
ncbi:MAG: hypothetical protein AB9834_22670 [Lentimicrobium sp.]